MGDRQGESSQCDKARKGKAVSECCETQVLDHGWAQVIRVVPRVPSRVGACRKKSIFKLGGILLGFLRLFCAVSSSGYR